MDHGLHHTGRDHVAGTQGTTGEGDTEIEGVRPPVAVRDQAGVTGHRRDNHRREGHREIWTVAMEEGHTG